MASFTTSHAFIIGINDYQHLNSLKTAVNDANELANLLQESFDYQIHGPYLNIVSTEVESMFERMLKVVKKNDRVLFYFAGHGTIDGDNDSAKFHLLVKDTRRDASLSISMDQISQLVQKLECKHFLMILDCCFAGAFKWSEGNRAVVFIPKKIYKERFDQYIIDPAWQVITSAAYNEKALDVFNSRAIGNRGFIEERDKLHSPFALALFQALMGEADLFPKGEGNGIITASELFTYLRATVTESTINLGPNYGKYRQTPSFFPLKKHDKGEFIFTLKKFNYKLLPSWKEELVNPYKGLQAYNSSDSNIFYGRSAAVKYLVDKITEPTNNLLIITGVSGIGKSSLVKAGLLPELTLKGFKCREIPRIASTSIKQLTDGLLTRQQGQVDLENTILFFDQIEELITHCNNRQEREAFTKEVNNLLAQNIANFKIIFTVRADFEPQIAQWFPKRRWAEGRYVVPSFTTEELKEIIVQPASQRVLFFEPPELVQIILDEVQQQQGILPLLSFTLSELYELYIRDKANKNFRALTLENYRKLGGVIGALQKKADELYNVLNQNEQRVMRKIFLRMTSLTSLGLAKRRILVKDLTFEEESENELIKIIIDRLVNETRLVIKGIEETSNLNYIEPAHDALINGWLKIREWIEELGIEQLNYTFIIEDIAKKYKEKPTPIKDRSKEDYTIPTLLWTNDPRLDIVLGLVKNQPKWFTTNEKDFIRLSDKDRQDFIEKLKKDKETAEVNLKVTQGQLLATSNATKGMQLVYDAEAIRKNDMSDIAKNDLFYSHYFGRVIALSLPTNLRGGKYGIDNLIRLNQDTFLVVRVSEILEIDKDYRLKKKWEFAFSDERYIVSVDICENKKYLVMGRTLNGAKKSQLLVFNIESSLDKPFYKRELDGEINKISFNASGAFLLITGKLGAFVLNVEQRTIKNIKFPDSEIIKEGAKYGNYETIGIFNKSNYLPNNILLSKGGKVISYDIETEEIYVLKESGLEVSSLFYVEDIVLLSSQTGNVTVWRFKEDIIFFLKSFETNTTGNVDFITNSSRDTIAIIGGIEVLFLKDLKKDYGVNWELSPKKLNGFNAVTSTACFLSDHLFICTDTNFQDQIYECDLAIHHKYWQLPIPYALNELNCPQLSSDGIMMGNLINEDGIDDYKWLFFQDPRDGESFGGIKVPFSTECFTIHLINNEYKALIFCLDEGWKFKVIDIATNKIEQNIDLGIFGKLCSHDFSVFPSFVAFGDNYGVVKILKKQAAGTYQISEFNFDDYRIDSLKFSYDLTFLMVGAQAQLYKFDLNSEEMILLEDEKPKKSCLAINRTNGYLLTGGYIDVFAERPSFSLWNLKKQKKIRSFNINRKTGEKCGVFSMHFMRNSRVITQDWDGFKIWDINSRKQIHQIDFPRTSNKPACYCDLSKGNVLAIVEVKSQIFAYLIETPDSALGKIIDNRAKVV